VTAAVAQMRHSFFERYPPSDLLAVRLPITLVLFVPLLAPTLLPSTRLLSLAVTCCIWVMVANGLHIIFSYTGQLSLAHTALWGVGAYAGALLLTHYGLPTPVLLVAAGSAGAIGAVLIGMPAFRTAGFSFAIITFAFAEIMLLVANNWTDLTGGSAGITISLSDAPTALGPIEFDTFNHLDNFYYLTLGFAYLSIAGVWLIRQSFLGRNFIAIRENETLAKSAGINVYLYKLLAFGLSGFFAGVAGVFLLYHQGHIGPDRLSSFNALFSIQILLMILIGGRFSMLGPAIGAVIVRFGPEVVNYFLGDILTGSRTQIVFGCLLMLSVLTAPAGVAGQTKLGFTNFVTVLRHHHDRGRSWPVSAGIAFFRSFLPLPVRYDVDTSVEERPEP